MSPATELAAHLFERAEALHEYGSAPISTRRYVRWTLIVIAACGSRKARSEARKLLRECR